MHHALHVLDASGSTCSFVYLAAINVCIIISVQLILHYCAFQLRLSVAETGRAMTGQVKGTKMMRVFVTDGREVPLRGTCIYFIREKKDVEVTSATAQVSLCSLSFFTMNE